MTISHGVSTAPGLTEGPVLGSVAEALKRARELPWAVSTQEEWREQFHSLLGSVGDLLEDQLRDLEQGSSGLRPGRQSFAEALSKQRDLVADVAALAEDTEKAETLSTAEYVAFHERTVMLESDVVRQQARLGGKPGHDPRTLVGAACKLPRLGVGT